MSRFSHRLLLSVVFALLPALCAPLLALPPPAVAADDSPEGADADPSAVIGLSLRGRHRAYPLELFAPPLVINDVISRQEVAIVHDPGRDLSAAYFRLVLGEPIIFAGPLAGTQAEDITTITRWDMATGRAVAGNLLGMELVPLPVVRTSWAEWFSAHPDTTVYSPEHR